MNKVIMISIFTFLSIFFGLNESYAEVPKFDITCVFSPTMDFRIKTMTRYNITEIGASYRYQGEDISYAGCKVLPKNTQYPNSIIMFCEDDVSAVGDFYLTFSAEYKNSPFEVLLQKDLNSTGETLGICTEGLKK